MEETLKIPLGRTPEEAVEKFRGGQMGRVIHRESVDGGMLLFYKKENELKTSGLQLEFVRKSWFGWKWGMGGGYSISFSYVQDASQKMAASFMAMPYSKGSLSVPFPIFFGELLDDSVQQVAVAVENDDVEQQATVIREGLETPIWFAALPRTAAVPYRIELYDGDGTMTGSKTVNDPTDSDLVTLRADANGDFKDWALSPLFETQGKDADGNTIITMLRGIENKLGMIDSPLIVGTPQKVLWHFWGDQDVLEGNLRIEGTSAETGDTVVLFETRLTKGASVRGSTTSAPSSIRLTELGLWKLDVYINDDLFGSVIVEGKDSY
ncbi:DUF4871 domain-containing protein [Paenibacillus sp. N4]|uniref:DUF4871 domain-containing protein n=1 Tax=Paenibacillus vietnamensis TaxID=2590547 RepID=UPI001CD0E80F|nr:DUF4871 domain-containing protein [Paenibacillus vietnamensis]MCA0757174.1 DUF4871 domain-containing protein [Paenibacillus vietnamensis]